MRILITGAAGFIGSHLVDRFLDDGHGVWGVDNFLTGREENTDLNDEHLLTWDVAEREGFYAFANDVKPNLVIHCAASYSDPDKWHRDTDSNVTGSINAALVAKHHGASLIYFQTILPPVSSYAISKIAGEQYLRLSGVPLTVFRLANIYGPRNLSGPIPVFYKRLTEDLPCHVVDTTRDMLFIEDLVECVLKSIDEKLTGTFDVCSGRQTSIMRLFRAISEELGAFSSAPLVPPGPDDVQGSIDYEKRVPGWEPTTELDDGIRMTVASYERSGVGTTHTHLRMKE